MALEEILRHPRVWRGNALAGGVPAVPTGFAELDAELPGGGWPAGALTELLVPAKGIGELGLLMPALARLTCAGKRVVWLAPPYLPYAPALAAAGIDLPHLALVRAAGQRDALWAAEQALRAGSCHALLAWLPSPGYAHLRRLALEPAEAGLRVHILKRRGAQSGAPLLLPVKRPFHALGRAALSRTSERSARAARRLGLPVHA